MREIKFRAWDGKEMHTDALSAKIKPAQEFDGLKLDAYYEPGFNNCNMKSLMQFTGLTDKNGVEIYEGDILQMDDLFVPVEFNDGCFHIYTNKSQGAGQLMQMRAKRFTVVGNIHQHPELLK
jgi:uncharacterized phage protein (TIGR01671 family)